jgi:putative transcriptional regulator
LLVANPFLRDEPFKRSVVLLTEHADNEGTVGYVLNQPTGITTYEATDGKLGSDEELYLGGPVQPETLHVLHDLSGLDNATEILPGLFWGGDLNELRSLALAGRLNGRVRFLSGYSGWGPRQLSRELRQKAWLVTRGSAEDVLDVAPDLLYQRSLERISGIAKRFAQFPTNPQLN